MTKLAREFNEKYNLVISDSGFEPLKEKIEINDLTGKPKKNIFEIFKRFFTNPVYAIAFAVFVLIFLLSYILPSLSSFNPNTSIVESQSNSVWFEFLPSNVNGSGKIQKYLSAEQINLLQNAGVSFKMISPVAGGSGIVEFDPWEYVKIVAKDQNLISVIGTDKAGRDIWTRTWAGTSKSLELALIVAIVTTTIGTLIGSWIGLYIGSLVDIFFMKALSIYNSIPTVVWYVVILTLLPPSQFAILTLLVITGWTNGLGTSRSFMWRYLGADFMKAAETIGVSKFKRIVKHAIPQYLGYIALILVGTIPSVISSEASLSIIGLSPNSSNASLGNVISEAQSQASVISEHIMYIMLPTIIIMVLTLSLHFIAIGINDAVDPKLKKR